MDLIKPSRPVDGIVTFEADWKTWTLLYGVNALCRLEAEVEEEEVDRLLGKGGDERPALATYRAAFWAGLREYHPNLTQEDAGRLMDHVGMARVGALIAQAIALASPDPEDEDRPRKARRRRRPDRA